MALSPVQVATATYAITATDIVNGYAGIPVVWPEPFTDTNYVISFGIHDISQPFLSLDYGVGDIHQKTVTGFTAVMTMPAAAPIVQGQFDKFNVNTAQTDTFTPLSATLYQVTIYMSSQKTDGTSYDQIQASINWTDSTGNPVTSSPTDAILGATGNPVGNTYPVYSNDMGTTISVSTAFTTVAITGTITTADIGTQPQQIVQNVTGASGMLAVGASIGTGKTIYLTGYSGGADNHNAWYAAQDNGTLTPSPAALPAPQAFHYNLSTRIVQMPTNSVIPSPGSLVIIEAQGIHI